MSTPFATDADVQARWRTLTEDEAAVAGVLAADASDIIRSRWADVDDRIAAGTLRASSVTRIVAAMVRRAMIVGDNEGWTQRSETAGPFTVSGTLSNPGGYLYLTADDVELFERDGYTRRSLVAWLA